MEEIDDDIAIIHKPDPAPIVIDAEDEDASSVQMLSFCEEESEFQAEFRRHQNAASTVMLGTKIRLSL